jgi:hypothetical protein
MTVIPRRWKSGTAKGNKSIARRQSTEIRLECSGAVSLMTGNPGEDSEDPNPAPIGRVPASSWVRKRHRLIMTGLGVILAVVAANAVSGSRYQDVPGTGNGVFFDSAAGRTADSWAFLQIGRWIAKTMNYQSGLIDPHQDWSLLMEDGMQLRNFVQRQIEALLGEFGADVNTVPPDFLDEVVRFVRQYQGRDHAIMVRALKHESEDLERVKGILRRDNLPEDLAYIVLVESGFHPNSSSEDGAVGPWQFMEDTARDYGMEVNETVDERLDLAKSTEAASRYLRNLILDFGSGRSVMLALAAYNSGPERVRRAVRNVKDPIRERNFWYLFSVKALPAETLDYVPKVFAAIIIGRNPQAFGF